ncbi:MAG: GNAT family N-acetyltransferase [Candidatus Thorarchaeota archaeon]
MNDELVVEIADDVGLYAKAWSDAMKHFYWYRGSPVFDFNKDEELDEIRADFGAPSHLFLIARSKGQDKIVGVLGLHYQDIVARIRRWEPAIIPQFSNAGVEEALLGRAMEYLSNMGIKRTSILIKHPAESPELVENHFSLYTNAGFERDRPDSIDMIIPLDKIDQNLEPMKDIHLETGENYTYEDLASIVVKSFTSSSEEREIHGFDKTVTEYIQATAMLQRMAEGYYGYSCDEFRKVAVVDGVPVGFLGAFISKSKYKPLTGILGPMAVLPNYRRQGIASFLVRAVLHTLKEYGCEYAAVGTPAANTTAIKMYEKGGFGLACRIINLSKEL